ncbi:dihydrolipoamide dehydrogenase [Williamsia limnetica]|uniref:Dihydrolipoyl dehydrogenase n=1 Tax=Williamsia limnetica TaxID=882452 RepID=A0A318RDA8_WILLI|nr:dihydrolipoamide dehydrogenase [Williamsia limnetica]
MVVGEMPDGVDLLVVGGGPGGYVAALTAAQLGRRVVLVDVAGPAGLGGVCVNVGCIPSKALIELASTVHDRTSWAARGVPSPSTDIDMNAFQTWKGGVVTSLNSGVKSLLKAANVEIRTGYFRFTRPDQGVVERGDGPPTHIQFKSCILATGSRPTYLDVLPHDGHRILDSTDVLDLDHLPQSAAIIGGGYIGVELGTALAKLGVAVSIIETAPTLLPTVDASVGNLVTKRLRALGVSVLTEATVTGDDGSMLHFTTTHGPDSLRVETVIVAVGRVPNTEDIGLDALRVTPNKSGLLDVGPDRLITRQVAAIGDITPGPALAHKATAEAHVAAEVLSGHSSIFDPTTLSTVIFSDPEVATTGLSAAEATDRGYNVDTATFPLSASGRARTLNDSIGMTQWIVDKSVGVVLGAQIVGAHATELIGEAALAIEMGSHLEDIAGTIHPHPTMSESLPEAALVGLSRPIHIPQRQ